ncbi:MAG: hypothetical protein ACE5JL_03835 [Dehalococcoidia bacterium]
MKKTRIALLAIIGTLAVGVLSAGATYAEPQAPKTPDMWICLPVSTNNANGMWLSALMERTTSSSLEQLRQTGR